MTDSSRFPALALIEGAWVDAPRNLIVEDPATGTAIAFVRSLDGAAAAAGGARVVAGGQPHPAAPPWSRPVC